MKTSLRYTIAAFAMILSASCSDLKDIQDRLDSAESRIEALETQSEKLLTNLETLIRLKEYHTVKSVEQDGDTYIITLTNGDKLNLYQGKLGFYTPRMTIDEEGYWKMTLTDEEGNILGENHVLDDGKKVKATGEAGVTPQFRVNGDEYWEVSYNNGTSWEIVRNVDGAPVKATPQDSADTYFSEVKVDDGKLVIKLKDESGSVISLPILGNFYFNIKDADGNDATGLYIFAEVDSKTFTIEQDGIAEDGVTILTKPAGFEVEVNGDELIVKAVSSSSQTKGLSADSGRDITILAASSTHPGLFAMEKLRVEKTTAPVVLAKDTDRQLNSLSFEITLHNSTGFYYMLLPATEDAPTVQDIKADQIPSTAETITVNGLRPETKYILYVISVSENGKESEMAIVKCSTQNIDPENLYEVYTYRGAITIGSEIVKYDEYGPATLITDNSDNKIIPDTGVYFIDPEATGVTLKGDARKLIISSVSPDKKASVTRAGQTGLYATDAADCLILSNIIFDVTNLTSGNMMGAKSTNSAGGTFEKIIFNACKFEVLKDKNLIYVDAKHNISDFIVRDSDIRLHAESEGTEKNLLQAAATQTYDSVDISNNVFYCCDGSINGFRLLANINGTVSNLDLRNNTFANVYPNVKNAQNGYISVKKIDAGTICRNLIHLPDYADIVGNINCSLIWMPKDTDEKNLDMTENLAYYNSSAELTHKVKCSYYTTNGTIESKYSTDNPIASPDYTNGIFNTGDSYKDYGAQR